MIAQILIFIRRRPWVTTCLVLIVAIGGANHHLWKKRRAVAFEHDEMRRKGEFMLRALANRPRIHTDLAALNTALGQVDRNLLDEGRMEDNLGYFYRLEKLSRVRLVRLNQLSAPPPTAGTPYKSVPFSMQVTGSYRNSMNFLRALETGPRILRVRNCSLERGPESNDVILDLSVDILAKA